MTDEPDSPPPPELNVANDLLGDPEALRQAWDRDGYWFFRNVLDHAALGRLRDTYRQELVDLGYCDADSASISYNGAPLDRFPHRMESLARRQLWKSFMAEPPIRSFFMSLAEEEPFWLPMAEYRVTPPAADRESERTVFIHQDAPFNAGMFFRVCWIPLVDIDDAMGGIVVAEGMHKMGSLHREADASSRPPPLSFEQIPKDGWRRSDYRFGDVLLMDRFTPHSGLSNLSDDFRLSLDIRLALKDQPRPFIGKVDEISVDRVKVSEDGDSRVFRLDEGTYCRNYDAQKIDRLSVEQHIHIGDEVMVTSDRDFALLLRPTH